MQCCGTSEIQIAENERKGMRGQKQAAKQNGSAGVVDKRMNM